VFLSVKAHYPNKKLRIGAGSFPLYWFKIGPDTPENYTVQFRGYVMPPDVTEEISTPMSIRAKLKLGGKDHPSLTCVNYRNYDFGKDDEEDEE
jgi:hypothetical protein